MARTEPARISEWYDLLADSYDQLYSEEQSEKHRKVLEILRQQRFGILIDAGCGSGKLLAKAKDNYTFAVGVDLSLKMLRSAKRTAASKECNFVRADCSLMPIRPQAANCLLSVSVIDFATGPYRTLRELRRITKSSGTMIISLLHSHGKMPPCRIAELRRQGLLSPRESLFVAQPTPLIR